MLNSLKKQTGVRCARVGRTSAISRRIMRVSSMAFTISGTGFSSGCPGRLH
jgi:hypothetical protein